MTDIKKAHQLLTIKQATTQVRRYVDKLMPGVMATVESKGSYDLEADTALMITTVTFPAFHHNRMGLKLAAEGLLHARSAVLADSSLVITRER